MVYLLYIGAFFFVPFHYTFDLLTVLVITLTFFIICSLCILYFKTDNSLNDAFKASMLATVILQLCCLLGQYELILSVNKPYHALGLIIFLGVLYALKKSNQWGMQLAAVVTIACLGGLWGMQSLLGTEILTAITIPA